MGKYKLLAAMNDNRPVYQLEGGGKFLYYSPVYHNWNVGDHVGAADFDMFVSR
jgi:hypothetical protein